jgi:hypothetical protein
MCNLFSVPRSQEAVRRLFPTRYFPGLPAFYPGMMAPVVHVTSDGERELRMMQ